MKTIAEQIKWDFKTNGSLKILDKNGNQIYIEASNGGWSKHEYDSKGNLIYIETSAEGGFWRKHEYDSQNNLIYWEDSNGLCGIVPWEDSNGEIEDFDFEIEDNRLAE